MMKLLIGTIMCLLSSHALASGMELADFSRTGLAIRQTNDIASLQRYRAGLLSILRYMRNRPDLFPTAPTKAPSILVGGMRKDALDVWDRWMDHYLALDSIYALHKEFAKLQRGQRQSASFHISRATLYMEYRFALDFIALCEDNPALDALFDESSAELGIPAGTYARFKYRFLNVLKAGEFGAYEVSASFFGTPQEKMLSRWIAADRSMIWRYGKGQGPLLTLQNAMDIFGDTGRHLILPVQKGIAGWMGHTKVHRADRFLITQEQIQILQYFLQPGDILLERREWYLSNIGLPGFWTHSALYVGSPEQRETFFAETGTISWARRQGVGRFEELLQTAKPEAYRRSRTVQANGHRPRVVEATARGVSFTTLESSAACDSLVILRPRVPKKDKAVAILRAFAYTGRPYDYEFDFLTDDALVCSELIYKAYRPGYETAGLQLPMERIMGRFLLTPNAIAKYFSETHRKSDRALEFVLFLDGYEKEVIARKADMPSFLESWQRPKWHVWVQSSPE